MAKKTSPPRVEVTFSPEDWTALLSGQPVLVRLSSGATFTAVIETKTTNSSAIWILRDDNLKTRQVFGHTEGIQLLPSGQTSSPGPDGGGAGHEPGARAAAAGKD